MLSATGTGQPSALLGIASWSVDMSQDPIEVTEFGDSNKTYVPGIRDITGSFDGFWNDAESKLFGAAASANGGFGYFYPDATNAPSKYLYGPLWISATIETGVNDAVTITGDFFANGAWGIAL
jgi:hypothetical protein